MMSWCRGMNEEQLQCFNTELIDFTIRWVLTDRSGYSMHNSLIYATKFVSPPNQDVWRQGLRPLIAGYKRWFEVLSSLQVETQSEGLKLLIQHAQKVWDGQQSRLDLALEPALDQLWTDFDISTKPDSIQFSTVMEWLRDLSSDDTARKQFDKMGSHALPYFESAVYHGAAHAPTAIRDGLHKIQSPHAQALINYLEQQDPQG